MKKIKNKMRATPAHFFLFLTFFQIQNFFFFFTFDYTQKLSKIKEYRLKWQWTWFEEEKSCWLADFFIIAQRMANFGTLPRNTDGSLQTPLLLALLTSPFKQHSFASPLESGHKALGIYAYWQTQHGRRHSSGQKNTKKRHEEEKFFSVFFPSDFFSFSFFWWRGKKGGFLYVVIHKSFRSFILWINFSMFDCVRWNEPYVVRGA